METNTVTVPASPETIKEVTTSSEEKMFEIRFEYHPNDDIVTVHTRKKFPRYDSQFSDGEGKQKSLHRSLLGTQGVVKVSTGEYELSVTKGNMFTWEELKPKIITSLKKHFSDGMKIKELPESRPHPDYLASLRHQGSDLRDF